MGLQAVPLYIGEALFNNPVENDRNFIEFLFQRTGIIRPGHFAVTPTATARQVSVAAGGAALVGVETSTQGAYLVWSDAADTYTFAAAVGNPRIDTLVMRAIDEQYGSDPGISRSEIEIVQGVAASSPAARADSYFNTGGAAYKPGAWYRLADVRINVVDGVLPAGQITQTKQYVRVAGFTICTSTTRPTDPQVGDRIHETDTGLRYWHDGTNFRPMPGVLIDNLDTTSGDISQASGNHSILKSRTFTAVAGQRYRIVFQSTYRFTNVSSSAIFTIRHIAGASIAVTDTAVRSREIWAAVTNEHLMYQIEGFFVASASGNYTLGIASNFFSGTGTLFHGANTSNYMTLDIYAA